MFFFIVIFTCILFTFWPSSSDILLAEGAGIDVADPNVSSGSGWKVIYEFDPVLDAQAGSGASSLDVVGDSTYPAAYIKFSEDGTQFAIRMRVNNCDGFSGRFATIQEFCLYRYRCHS